MSEGLDKNPPPHHEGGRHELCEVCGKWFPQAEIEFLAGKFSCEDCRVEARKRMSGHAPRASESECQPLAWPELNMEGDGQ